MESWLRPLSVICTRGFSRLEMQRSFARTSSAHSTLAKVVQSISRCTNTCYIFLAHNTNNHPPLWSWRTKFAIILIDVKTTFINSPTLNWAANMIFYTPFSLHWESCVMRHFQDFLLAIDVASFEEMEHPEKNSCGLSGFIFWDQVEGFFLLWRCRQNQLQMYDVDGNGVIDQQDGMTKIVQQVNVRIWRCTSKPTISQTQYPSPGTLEKNLTLDIESDQRL